MNGIKLFIYSAGAILLAAALERLLVAAGHSAILALPDPMLGIELCLSVLLVGGIELIVALICLFGRQTGLQLGCLAWLTTNYAIYRMALPILGLHHQASCIGRLTDPLELTGGTLGVIAELWPICLLLGSYAAACGLWRAGRKAKAAQFLKMSCPACGIHIRFDEANLGQKVDCPYCRKTITLRKPDLLKIPCFYCHKHIEFPSHAIGEKTTCPHCRTGIILKEPV